MTAPHRGIDTTANLTDHLDMMRANGITHAARYLSNTYKGMQKPECDAVRAAGITLILNFEGAGNRIGAFSAQMGTSDAQFARAKADMLGAPAGTAIYFSCEPEDYGNLTTAYTSRVLPYWRAAKAALGPYRIGAYSFGTWLTWLARDGANEFNWLPNATGWPGYREFLASNKWHYHQTPGGSNVKFNGLEVDWDEPNPSMTDIGAWAPGGTPGTLPPPVIGHPVLRKGAKGPDVIALQTLLHITADGDFGPLTDKAVKDFQTAHGLDPDGAVGPLTRKALGLAS